MKRVVRYWWLILVIFLIGLPAYVISRLPTSKGWDSRFELMPLAHLGFGHTRGSVSINGGWYGQFEVQRYGLFRVVSVHCGPGADRELARQTAIGFADL